MPRAFLARSSEDAGRAYDRGRDGGALHRGRIVADERQPDLPPAAQFDIDLREQLRVEQRAVDGAVAAVDAVAVAQRIQAVLRAGVARAGEHDRVDHAMRADMRMAAALQLAVEETEIEARIVRDQRAVGDEFEQVQRAVPEQRLVGQERV